MGSNARINILLIGFFLAILLIIGRLFFWQIVSSEELSAVAKYQHGDFLEIPAQRGKIFARDKFPLVTNQEAYLVFASLPKLNRSPKEIADDLAPLIASPSVSLEIEKKLTRTDVVWVPIAHKVDYEIRKSIETLALQGIGFEEETARIYPEASSAAHLLGFVGSDINGQEKGYFGLEGYYDRELRGKPGWLRQERDALGAPILVGESERQEEKNGRDLVTTIDRAAQFIVEKRLKDGIKRYGAKSGSVVVMDPSTGEILSMVSFPSYDPARFSSFAENLYPNPIVSSSYEPGSTFKVLTMAAGIDSGVVKPDTQCTECDGPRKIAEYTIKTWNDKYPTNPTMTEVIQQSNNVGMVFVGEKLGVDRLVDYLEKFGLSRPTGIDLEGEISPKFRPKDQWKNIDVATASFGQGIAISPIQMVRAVGALANKGKLMKPFVVKEVVGEDGQTEIKPEVERVVVKPSTARTITEMMVNAVDQGEAKWCKPKGYRVAGKTGTAQIPVAGHYDEEKTIASFVGFAPADEPKFVMLVTLREPTSSPWGSETAAPLWFDIASDLFAYWGIQPDY
jgi:cell division protein FtsI/penicillin-binding protein 2